MLSNKIVKLGEYMYRVYPYTSETKLELGNAYVFGGESPNTNIVFRYVLPYNGKLRKDSSEPGIYMDKSDSIHIISPKLEREKAMYSVSRVFELTPDTINTELDQYLGEIDINDLKYTGDVFRPDIKNTDDVGIKSLRLALIGKKIDFNSYSGRFERAHDKANARKALMNDDTLTFSKLKQYADIFDLEYGVILFDRKGAKDPLSKKKNAMVVFNDESFDISDPNIKVINTIDEALMIDDL